nr:hypothetical protein [Tanacetum cinerariifolium]
MPELEDITYSDDEEDVGVEADFTNLETTITVSPIPTKRVHKDHHNTDGDAAFEVKEPEFKGRKPQSEVYVSLSKLEDITYSDDEEDVGVEADFTNLETTITVSPIPTKRVHKDHHVTQIIGDLSSST